MPQSGSTGLPFGLVPLLLLLLHTPGVRNGFACLSNPCVHGVCLDDLNSTYFCYCIDGYTGLQCQTNWNDCWSSPCCNGGMCVDGIASFNCTCPAGFIGDLCEEDFNECESNPCWNNGTCVDGPNGYVCQCLPGYSGVHCEVDIAVCNTTEEARCHNAGVCEEGPGDTFSCRCQPGWEGFLCDTETNECMSAPCQNGAVCIDYHAGYECACLFGYTGKNCEELIKICDKNPCKNGALCLTEDNESVCYCVPDFHGDQCQLQYDECQLGPKCSNGGTCIDGIDNFTCSCPPNLTGVFCECLILPDGDDHHHQLDCSYVAPISTTTTATFETESTTATFLFSEKTTAVTELPSPPSTVTVTTTTTQVPNITMTAQSTEETSTVPYCITQTPLTSTMLTTSEATSVETSPESTTLITSTTSSTMPSTILFTEASTISEISTTISNESFISTSEETDTSSSSSSSSASTEASTETSTETTTIIAITTTSTPTTATSSSPSTETPPSTVAISTHQPGQTTIVAEVTAAESTTIVYPTPTPTTLEISTSTETILEPSSRMPSAISTEVTTSAEATSSIIDYTLPPINITIIPTEPSALTTTTILPASTTTTESTITTTTEEDRETNRTFPEGQSTTTTVLPSTSTFFTDHPSTETTTSSTPLTTTTIATITVDCTLPDQRCHNGGTCIFTGEGHRCLCPFDSEGTYCETKLGIKNAAFNGNSYLSHRLPPGQNSSLEFEARTLSTSGLLFYTHLDKTYMMLYLENGFMVFKFSCGYQTMLLSELKVPVNNGLVMNIKASLEFSKDLKHCDALIKVNDTLSMSGDQMARMDKLQSKSTAWLHLGGIPNEVFSEAVPSGGFVGCMSNLKILGKKMYIYKDAEDGYEVAECSSLACLSNPCKNGASCSSQGDVWKCHCRNGFLGKLCEISICDNNPCLFGGTCIPFSNSGYICLCPYGKHGHFCENDLKITEPYFSSTVRGLSSFIAYPLPQGIAQKMEIKFRFTPSMMEQIALLLFIGQNGQHDFYSDHLAVSFVKGYVMLTWNMGSGPRRIFTSQPIESGARDYLVRVGYESRRAWLFVDNLGNVTGRSPGNAVQLDIVPLLYLGGHDSRNFSSLPHDLPLHSGFSGCIFDVQVKIGRIVLPLQGSLKAIGRAVGQCGTTECYERSCQNGGACLHHGSTFMCLCQDHWYGPLCSSKKNFCDVSFNQCSEGSRCVPLLTSYECDCPFGRVGNNCEKADNITDISFTGTRSFLSTRPFEIDNAKFNIEMQIRMLKDTGIVLFIGKGESSFVCLSIQNGLLELRVHSSKTRANIRDPLTVRSSKLLLKGVWHTVQFGVFGRKVYLYVDHIINMAVLDHGFMLHLPNDSIYLGGLSDMSKLPITASPTLPIPYTGCLRHLSIDETKVSLTQPNIVSARNVVDCDGTPCGGEACQNGGTCWLDSFTNPHCSCVEPYYGDQCELVPNCTENNCNHGHCHNASCSCHIGFEGGLCETEIEVKTPAFVGKSYLIVQKLGDKKRNVPQQDLEIRRLYLNFTTAKDNGLLIWTRRDKSFLGLGLEKGYLKIAYSRNGSQTVEIAPFYKLSDGLWHHLELMFVPLLLKVDNKVIKLAENNKETKPTTALSTNGIFFIGGLPSNNSLVKETNGMFPRGFDGCIEAFGANNEDIVTDFMPYEGVNVNNCNIL